MTNEGRLPKPKGRQTVAVKRALRIYRRLYNDVTGRKIPIRKVTLYRAYLNVTLSGLSRRETDAYYAGVQKIRIGE